MKLIFILVFSCFYYLCSGQLEGYQYSGLDEFIIIDDKNRISFKLSIDGNDGITGFYIAGSGTYRINKLRNKIKVFIDSSIDSLESDYDLMNLIDSDTTKVYLTVFDVNEKPANAVNICYIIDDMIFGDITNENGNAYILFKDGYLPKYIKVHHLLTVPAYIPINNSKISYYKVYLKKQSISFFKSGIVNIKVCLNHDFKKIKVESIKVIKEPINTCL